MRDVTIEGQESSLKGGDSWAETSVTSGYHGQYLSDLQHLFFWQVIFNEPLLCACYNMYDNYTCPNSSFSTMLWDIFCYMFFIDKTELIFVASIIFIDKETELIDQRGQLI